MSLERPSATYIHGTSREEQSRLTVLNRLTNRAFVEFLGVERGWLAVEVGSGLGILAGDVAASANNVTVVGVEVSPQQIAEAILAPRVRYVRGDAHALAFRDASFDLAYARFVLEHVGDPILVASEMRRVLKPGGRAVFLENDTSLVRMDPPCPAFERVWAAFAELQARLGGDAFIGRRLFRLLQLAGFRDIRLSLQPDIHWYGDPVFVAWIENIIGNVESARAALIGGLFCSPAMIDEAVGELTAHANRTDASSGFAWNRAVAVR